LSWNTCAVCWTSSTRCEPVDRAGHGRHALTDHVGVEVDPDQSGRQRQGEQKTQPHPAPSLRFDFATGGARVFGKRPAPVFRGPQCRIDLFDIRQKITARPTRKTRACRPDGIGVLGILELCTPTRAMDVFRRLLERHFRLLLDQARLGLAQPRLAFRLGLQNVANVGIDLTPTCDITGGGVRGLSGRLFFMAFEVFVLRDEPRCGFHALGNVLQPVRRRFRHGVLRRAVRHRCRLVLLRPGGRSRLSLAVPVPFGRIVHGRCHVGFGLGLRLWLCGSGSRSGSGSGSRSGCGSGTSISGSATVASA
jgi:hypothetical protein